jgi:anti-anti-sigma factor
VAGSVDTEQIGGIDVVRLVGEHDVAMVPEIDQVVHRALSDRSSAMLLIDLTSTEFIDSAIVAALIRWSNEAQVSDHEALAIAVGGVASPVARLLKMVHAIDLLPVFETVAAAREALLEGQRPRSERAFGWLSDRQLEEARVSTLAAARAAVTDDDRDDAAVRLGRIVGEQQARRDAAAATGQGADAGARRASAEATAEADDNPSA